MAAAARLPAAMASTALAGPRTRSPPAKTPGRPRTMPHSLTWSSPGPKTASISRSWPTALMIISGLEAPFRTGNGFRPRTAAGVRRAQPRPLGDETVHPAFDQLDPDRLPLLLEDHALGDGLVDLRWIGGHLGPPAPVKEGHAWRAQPHRRARGVKGAAAAPDHRHRPGDGADPAVCRLIEEGDGVGHAGRFLARDAQTPGALGAGGDEDRPVPVLLQRVEGEIRAESLIAARISTPAARIRSISRSSTARGRRKAGMPCLSKPPASPSRSRTVTRYPCCANLRAAVRPAGPAPTTATRSPVASGAAGKASCAVILRISRLVVGQEPFDLADGQGFILVAPVALRFARVRADPAADGRKRVVPPDQGQRLGEFPFAGQSQITLDVDPGGAGADARGLAPFVHHEGAGHGLGERPVDRRALGEAGIESIGRP